MTSRTPNHLSFRSWRRRLMTACLAGCAAAAVAAFSIVAVYQWRPALRLGMDRPFPSGARGFYPLERQGQTSFAWSGGEARLVIGHLDRRGPWACRADLINWRPQSAGPARIQIRSGGSLLVDRLVREPTAGLDFTIPADPALSGIDVVLNVSPTFRPGPQDPRELGLAFDAISCDPAGGFTPRPAASVIARGAGAAAIAGIAVGLTGLPAMAALVAGSALAAAQAWSLASGGAVYSLASPPVFLLAGLFGFFCLLPAAVASGVMRKPLSTPALLAVVVSASGFYLKLIFLLHPDKDLVDAVFHAHRFEWVRAGRFYFTQLSTSATPFPYAIGLYVFSAPFALLTSDHVTLLRIVVCAAEAAAGVLLYPVILRAWGDRAAGVMAVVLFHVLPVPYTVIGNANQTAMFGQSVGMATMIAAMAWAFEPRGVLAFAGLTALASLAFLSHVGTLALLLPMLLTLATLISLAGGEARRRSAVQIVAATSLALVMAVVLYYAHFGSVYLPHFERARSVVADTLGMRPAPRPPIVESPQQGQRPPSTVRKTPLELGVRGAIRQTWFSLGWPIILLALAGAWSLADRRQVDGLVVGLVAWFTASLFFLGWSALRTVDPLYVQDAWEFIGRVELAMAPAGAVLAARGAVWGWRAGPVRRAATVLIVATAVWMAARALAAWIP